MIENDLTPARLVGLYLLALIMTLAMVANSFYNDDSPIQIRCEHGASGSFTSCGLTRPAP